MGPGFLWSVSGLSFGLDQTSLCWATFLVRGFLIQFTLHNANGNHYRGVRKDLLATSKVIFGSSAMPKQIPWQIQFINYGELKCGGTLITPNKIVSAAHCFSPQNFPQTKTEPKRPHVEHLEARAGSVLNRRGSEGSQQRKCSDIILHS